MNEQPEHVFRVELRGYAATEDGQDHDVETCPACRKFMDNVDRRFDRCFKRNTVSLVLASIALAIGTLMAVLNALDGEWLLAATMAVIAISSVPMLNDARGWRP